MLELKNINKVYHSKNANDTEALKNINLSFDNKGLNFVLGKSGCGKSTLLNILGGLDIPTSGEIVFKGKSFNSFKSKDYDSYRNSSVGFVFQEYNLIEKYNVFDNVSYALKLQNSKINKNEVYDVLDRVGIKNLASRNINELSGGQKQRVAIARALIKNPSIILADEPTGNLDSESSKNIFELLNELSKERLVIIVSHDEESAIAYGDRIINLQDGVVISDTNPNTNQDENNYILKKNHLPFKEAFRFAIKNIFGRKGKLILSVMLISFALSLLGFSIIQNDLRSNKEVKRLINEFNLEYINIKKLTTQYSNCLLDGYWYNCNNVGNLTKDDYDKLSTERKTPLHKRYYFTLADTGLITWTEEVKKPGIYYYIHSNARTFTELKKEEFNFKIIGSVPNNLNEIVIIKPVADYILEYGTILYDDNGEEVIYKPQSYEDLISSRKEMKFGNGRVIISGIVDDNLKKFEPLKKIHNNDIQNNKITIEEKKLVNEYMYKYPVSFYALDGFKDNIELREDDDRLFYIGDLEKTERVKKFTNKEVYTENGKGEMNKLDSTGIVVNSNYLDTISDGKFSKELYNYVTEAKEKNSSKTTEEYEEEYITKYIKENGITNKIVTVLLINYDEENNNKENTLSLRILGVVTDDDYFYASEEILKHNASDKYKFQAYALKEEIKDMDNFLNEYPIDGEQYIINIEFINTIINHEFTMKIMVRYILIIGIIFSLFALLMLFNFLGLSIADNKKEIGILRALGTTQNDVSKIYSVQGLLIGSISYFISIFLVHFYARVENNLFFEETKEILNINLFGLSVESLGITFIFCVIVILLSTISVSLKISKMKPIDAINNK